MYKTYILKSLKDDRYYFGHTMHMDTRLHQHNIGKVKSTKGRTSFVIHYTEEFISKAEVFKRELFFKSFDGRNWLKQNNII